MAESSTKQHKAKHFQKRHFVNTSEHIVKKRAPPKPDNRNSVIYVSGKSNIKALLEKCDKLIKNNEQEITLHCMGAAIQRGILLALQICEKYAEFEISANTATVELVDDLEPVTDEADYEILKRNNSALRIKVFSRSALPQ